MVHNSSNRLAINRTRQQTVTEFESDPFDFVARCGAVLYSVVPSYSDNETYLFQQFDMNDEPTTRFAQSVGGKSHNDILIDAYNQPLNCSNGIITFIARETTHGDTDEENDIKTVTIKLWKWDTRHDSLSSIAIMNDDGTPLSDGEGFIFYDENSIENSSIVFVSFYSGILYLVDTNSGRVIKQRKIFDPRYGMLEMATNGGKIVILVTDPDDINEASITFYDKKTLEKLESIPLDRKLKDALWRGYWNTSVNHISINPRY